jgi:hypothetical protein
MVVIAIVVISVLPVAISALRHWMLPESPALVESPLEDA